MINLNYIKIMYNISQLVTLSLILCYLAMGTVLATEIKTTIDRDTISANESLQIIFTATESPDEDPDFNPLKENFEVLNQTQQSNSSWVNGKSSKTIQWILTVMPKKIGRLLIPAISFGDDLSQVQSVIVTKKSVSSAVNNEDLFLEVEVSTNKPFVQSQVIYTLRFFRRVQIAQARLAEPEMSDAIIEKLGEDNNYTSEINGIKFTITERKYAIFPQKSGSKLIKPLILTAEIISSTSTRPRFNGFFNRQNTVTKRIMSEAITLNVQKAPDTFTGKYWIPAEHVYIEEKWSGDINNMKVGEPLTRTLTMFAKGITVAQIPELNKKNEQSQLKSYPDQPVLKEKKQEDGLIAFREEKIAYIPSKAGSFSLAAIEIPWFNIKSHKMDVARIAGTTITAIASHSESILSEDEVTKKQSTIVNQQPTIQVVENRFWMWLSIILALGWLISILFFIRQFKSKPPKVSTDFPKEIILKETIKALKQACFENNTNAAKNALLDWGKIKYNSGNLSEIAKLSEARLRDEIILLNQYLYSNISEQWQGKKLFQTFTENKARKQVAKKMQTELEPLYKL